jgi:cytochrome oxidase Cu insertion factor (SCO1/SenC/PrrC family)
MAESARPLAGRVGPRGRVVLAAAAALGVLGGVAAALLSQRGGESLTVAPTRPDATWPAGAKAAPDFRLADQDGRPLSLRALRGRVVIVTFVDPLCRNLCPLEAKVLTRVERDLGAGRAPALVAVSVNPPADTPATFREDARAWQLPAAWRWAVGRAPALARVWRGYRVAVQTQRKTIAGVTVSEVAHTEAAYLVDPAGYQRALFLYPFLAADVEREVRTLSSDPR